MRMGSVFRAVFLGFVMAWSSPAPACDAAGPGTHVGSVISVDRENGTFSIMDAEKMVAISFSAGREILDQVEGTNAMAIVNYEDTGGGLRATGVTLQ